MYTQGKLRVFISKLKATGMFHIFGASVFNKIISFASTIILVRIISKSDYGVYAYANNIYNFFLIFSGLGMGSALLQVCSEAEEEHKRKCIYNYGTKISVQFNFLLGIIIVLVAIILPLPIEGSNILLMMMSFLPMISLLPDLQRIYLQTSLRLKEFSYSNIVAAITQLVFTCLLSWPFKTKGLIIAFYITNLLIVLVLVIRNKVPLYFKNALFVDFDKRGMVSIGIISIINNGLSRLMYLLDVFLLGIYIPDKSIIASYNIATTIPIALLFIPTSVVTYIYPYFARNRYNRNWLISKYKLLVLNFGLLNLLLSSLLFLFASSIIHVVFGRQYMDAVIPFKILCVSYFFSSTFRIISGNLLVTHRKLKFNTFVAVLSSLTNTVLNVVLVPKWASIGAAIASLATVVITSLLNTIFLVRTFKKVKPNLSQTII